jgi:hypothetical protein
MASICDFEGEFIHDLESFIRNPMQIEPIEIWAPRQTAAPERHFMLGKLDNKSVDTQVYMLRDNYAFQDIESILHISFHAVDYAECGTTIHPVKEQVWLFGYKWLEKYLAFIAKPGAMKKEFYRQHNDRFLELIGSFLVYNINERITFYDALRFWNPQHMLLSRPCASSGGVQEPGIIRKPAAAAAVSTAVASPPIATNVVTNVVGVVDHPNPIPPLVSTVHSAVSSGTVDNHHPEGCSGSSGSGGGRRRLNLIRLYDSVGRTKTRRVYNSTHSPASDNRGWINQD